MVIINPFLQIQQAETKTNSQTPDIQFFPEGGNFVYDLENTLAFRVINHLGQGMTFQGQILDDLGQHMLDFQPTIYGIGRLSFTPVSGRSYEAKIIDESGNVYRHNLPNAQHKGYALKVIENENTFDGTLKPKNSSNQITFQVYHKGKQVLEKSLNLKENFSIAKSDLPFGVSVITFLDNNEQAVAERLIFNKPPPINPIPVQIPKQTYSTRSPVLLQIGLPKSTTERNAFLSVSVRKLSPKADSFRENIQSYLLVSQELKGVIENPAYYFQEGIADFALDNLMLSPWLEKVCLRRAKCPDIELFT